MYQPNERNGTRPLDGSWGGRAVAPASRRARPAATECRDDVLKVSTRSRSSAVAGAIAGVIRQTGAVEVQAIGAGATNQAIKAIVIARFYLQEEGRDLAFVPVFMDVVIATQARTGLRLVSEQRPALRSASRAARGASDRRRCVCGSVVVRGRWSRAGCAGGRSREEALVVGINSSITYILPDEGWAPLLEIIVRECPAASVIEVNTPGMQVLAERMLQEVDRQDVAVALRPQRAVPRPPTPSS